MLDEADTETRVVSVQGLHVADVDASSNIGLEPCEECWRSVQLVVDGDWASRCRTHTGTLGQIRRGSANYTRLTGCNHKC